MTLDNSRGSHITFRAKPHLIDSRMLSYLSGIVRLREGQVAESIAAQTDTW